jgi:hypothetical protein
MPIVWINVIDGQPAPSKHMIRPQLRILGISRDPQRLKLRGPPREYLPQPGVGTVKLLNQLHSEHVRHKSRSSPSTPSD